MKRALFSAVAISALVCVAGPAFAAASVTAMNDTLSAAPAAYAGKCPAVITFTGTITVRGNINQQNPVQIGYQFLRSDNATGPIAYYTLTAPGSHTVSDTWTLGGASLPTYSGWQQLKAWPTAHDGGFGYSFSPKANFTVTCRPQ